MNNVVINSLVVALEIAFSGRTKETEPVADNTGFSPFTQETEAVLQPVVKQAS